MPLQKLQFRPGVNREGTTLSNEGGWYDCDKIRFRSGYPEKIGGWAALSYNTFLGVCRSLWNWVTLKSFNLVGVGTNLKFYIEDGGAYYDITPIREINGNTPSAGPPVVNASTITLTASGTVLTISDTSANNLQANDFVTIAGAGTIGGVDVNGEYQIATVTSGTTYTITLPTSTSGSNSAATITIAYQINTGFATSTVGTGWGTGPWSPYLIATLTDPFATNTGTPTVITVTQAAHGLDTGDYVYFSSISDADVGGIPSEVLEKAFQITKTGTNTYTISTVIGSITYNATSTDATAGGTVVVNYPEATSVASYDRGWGTGFTTGFGLQLRLWSQSNFGETLLFSPRGGSLYEWSPGALATPAFGTRGTVVSGTYTPSIINEIMVSDTSRITIAFGCNDPSGTYATAELDPMQIRWTAQESYTQWQPILNTNQAGDYRLSHGSAIVGALQTRQEILVWTDAAIYSMQYLGPPYIYGFTLLSDNISVVSPNAMATAAGVVYWMGVDKFYVYSGRVETLPCSVRTYIFNDINRDQMAQTNSGTNEGYSEVWWNYCSITGPDGTGTPENPNTAIDRYVIFNYLDRVWYYGTLDRTAWLDSPLRPYPLAATSNNLLVYHEAAVDDGAFDPPVAINAYVQSSDFDIEDGHNYGYVWRIIPDITFDGSNTLGETDNRPYVNFTVRPRQNPGANYGVTDSPTVRSKDSYAGQTSYRVQLFTEIVYSRVRGRQMAFKVESNSLGTQWQLGVPRIDVRPDGRN
jgi:hypothetical protein